MCPANATYGFPQTKSGLAASANCPANQTGTVSGLCKSDGTWGVDTSKCTAKTCPLTTRQNSVLPESQGDGSIKTGSCLNGLSGSVSAVCSPNGTWTDIKDTCRTMCTLEKNPGWFGASATPIEIGATITSSAKCPAGTIGTVTGQCLADGTIESKSANCLYKYCPAATASNYNLPKADVSTTLYNGTCPSGQKGAVSALCKESQTSTGGAWSSIATNCKKLVTIRDETLKAWNDTQTALVNAQKASDDYDIETSRLLTTNCSGLTYPGISYCTQGWNSSRASGKNEINSALTNAKTRVMASKTAYDLAVKEYNDYANIYGPQIA